MMKKQVTIVAALLILVALSSNLDIVVAVAQLGSGPYKKLGAEDCYDACSTGCVNPDNKKLIRCEHKCYIRCGGPGAESTRETRA